MSKEVRYLDMSALAKELKELQELRECCHSCDLVIYEPEPGVYKHGARFTKHGETKIVVDDEDAEADIDHKAEPDLDDEEHDRLEVLEALQKELVGEGNDLDAVEGPIFAADTFPERCREIALESEQITEDSPLMPYVDWKAVAEDARANHYEFDFNGEEWIRPA